MTAKPNLFTPPSMTEAQRMLNMLDAGGEFTFQTFADADKSKNLVHICHGSLEAHFDTLARLNGQGAGIFVTVNQTDLKGRTSDNITRVRALWVDFDKVDPERVQRLQDMPFAPNLIVESSAGKHHAYWILDAENGAIPLDQFSELQKRLIHHFADDGADKAVHDLPRVMRLAGFYHCKGEPFMTRVVHSDAWYEVQELIEWVQSLPMPEAAKPEAQVAKPKAQNTHTTQQAHSNLDFKQVKLLARGRWSEILGRLGYSQPTLSPQEHGACPMCGGSDRFRFDNENGDGSFICSQGTGEAIAGDGFTLLEHGGYSAADALQAVGQALAGMGLISEYDSSKPMQRAASLQILNMSSIKAQAINWLWDGWLPLGKLTILAGAGGCGKTNLLLALIATITTKGIFPDGAKCEQVGKVLIYSTEDDPADTLKPRLIANGADTSKIDFIAGRINQDGEREPFDPTKDLPMLYEYAKQNPDIKLLMIDPIISAVGGDSNKATDVRKSLQVLVDFAQEFDCAVVGITHFAKGTSGSSPAERIIGSQAFTALARMVWSAAKREDEGDCILVRAKSNISTLDGGIRYQIEPETVLDGIETTKTAWLGTIEGTAKELLNEAESTESYNGSAVDMAKDFLVELLSDVEHMPSKEIQSQAREAGFSAASVRRAQEALNIKPFRPHGEKVWFWALPKIHRLDEPTHF